VENPSNLSAIRALVAKLGNETLRADPGELENQIKQLLADQGAEVPNNLGALLAAAPDAKQYQALEKELAAYHEHLMSRDIVEKTLKLASPLFGLHCPFPAKLA
jgi:hypothetical protein